MTKQLRLIYSFVYRKDTGVAQFQDIQRFDFQHFSSQMTNSQFEQIRAKQEQLAAQKEKKENENEENADGEPGDNEEELEEESPGDARLNQINDVINLLSRAAYYAKTAKAWVQFENIIRCTWNLFYYNLGIPSQFCLSDAWLDIVCLSESALACLDHINSGGALRILVQENKMNNKKTTF
jgi:hypothetical protein